MFKSRISASIIALILSAIVVPGALFAHEGREVDNFEVEVGFLHEPALEGQANGAFIRILKQGVDLESHGGLFSSGAIQAGNNWEYEFGHELEDLMVPFHDHLTGNGGTVMVAHDAESTGTVMVGFTPDGFSPSELHVQPGTTIMFMNTSASDIMTVLSGPHDLTDDHTHDDPMAHAATVPVLDAAATLQVDVIHVPSGATRTMTLRPIFGEEGSYVADFVPTAPGAYTFRFYGEIEGEAFDESFTSGQGTFDEIEPARSAQFPIELRETRELQGAIEGLQSELALASDAASDADNSATTALIVGLIGLIVGVIGISVGGYSLLSSRRRG